MSDRSFCVSRTTDIAAHSKMVHARATRCLDHDYCHGTERHARFRHALHDRLGRGVREQRSWLGEFGWFEVKHVASSGIRGGGTKIGFQKRWKYTGRI
ncbi:hypothetical protein BDR03DRAFT_714511 [Suillus americanus]|nr:hypothetical protein BDR03DRAFT_714511 [Suillus americanus]